MTPIIPPSHYAMCVIRICVLLQLMPVPIWQPFTNHLFDENQLPTTDFYLHKALFAATDFTIVLSQPRILPKNSCTPVFNIICDQTSKPLNSSIYSKTSIYRASWGKGIRPGKSRSTVYRGTFYTDLHTKLVFGG